MSNFSLLSAVDERLASILNSCNYQRYNTRSLHKPIGSKNNKKNVQSSKRNTSTRRLPKQLKASKRLNYFSISHHTTPSKIKKARFPINDTRSKKKKSLEIISLEESQENDKNEPKKKEIILLKKVKIQGDQSLERKDNCVESVEKFDQKNGSVFNSSKSGFGKVCNQFDLGCGMKSSRKVIESKHRLSSNRYRVDDLVIGKISGFGWWFGKVVNHIPRAERGFLYVYWYGDHKTFQFPISSLVPYSEFHLRFNQSRLRQRKYKRAVHEFLEDASILLSYTISEDSFSGKRFQNLLQWALKGFCHVKVSTKTIENKVDNSRSDKNPETSEKITSDYKIEQTQTHSVETENSKNRKEKYEQLKTEIQSESTSEQENSENHQYKELDLDHLENCKSETNNIDIDFVKENVSNNKLNKKGVSSNSSDDLIDSTGQIFCLLPGNVDMVRKKCFSINDLIIGYLKRFGWWFGKVVKQRKDPQKGYSWVSWFGDHRITEISHKDLEEISLFSKRYRPVKMKKIIYKTAVKEVLFEAAKRFSKPYIPDGISPKAKHNQLNYLIKWAMLGFQEESTVKHCNVSLPLRVEKSKKYRSLTECRSDKFISKTISENSEAFSHSIVSDQGNEDCESPIVLTNSIDDINQLIENNEFPVVNDIVTQDVTSLKKQPNESSVPEDSLVLEKKKSESIELLHKSKRLYKTMGPIFELCAPKRRKFLEANKALSKNRNRRNKDEEKKTDSKMLVNNLKQNREGSKTSLKHTEYNIHGEIGNDIIGNSGTLVNEIYGKFKTHDLVIGNVKGFGWWFGKIVSPLEVKQRQPLEGCCWIYWFGDHSVNEMFTETLETLDMFSLRFDSSRLKKRLYFKAVQEILSEAANHCLTHNQLFDEEDTESLINWAVNGFKPTCIDPVYKPCDTNRNTDKETNLGLELSRCRDKQSEKAMIEHIRSESSGSIYNDKEENYLNRKLESNQMNVESGTKKRGRKPKHSKLDSPASFDLSSSLSLGELRQFKVGDLVIGKLKRFDWWFGKVIDHKIANQDWPRDGHCWIYWFGDRKVSEMSTQSLESLENFSKRFIKSKLKGVYQRAVKEVLTEAAKRCKKKDFPDQESSGYLTCLIEWALNGFRPMGVDAVYTAVIEKTSDDPKNGDDSMDSFGSDDDPGKETLKKSPRKSDVSPLLSTDIKKLFDLVAEGEKNIEDLCLACGDIKIEDQHPLFEGGLCKECKVSFMECAYLCDDDGYQMFCAICSDGEEIILCDQSGCSRSYCTVCIDMFCGVGYSAKISKGTNWGCFLCTGKKVGVLQRRCDWQDKMKEMFQSTIQHENFTPIAFYETIAPEKRKPIRVLALFDGIATGCLALNLVGIDVEVYVASEIDTDSTNVARVRHGDKISHVGDVRNIYKKQLDEWGPFDLLIGGSPCNDLSIANPNKKGIFEGTGRLFFEFYRIKELLLPHPIESRPFFWLFENVVGMRYEDREVITRFLQCNPVIINSKDVSAQQRSRYFWGNLPGMNRQLHPTKNSRLSLQECLEPNCGRIAKMEKVRCITTMSNSLRQTKNAILPVRWVNSSDVEDGLWLTEIERIFGFPEHYTDVGNMGRQQRQKLLGKSWSVNVICHLFNPLKNYFKIKS